MLRFFWVMLLPFITACYAQSPKENKEKSAAAPAIEGAVKKTSIEWQQCLTPEQYQILRQKGTERAFTGKYYDHHEEGVYVCAGCKNRLFASNHKFDSGTGWPSYWQPLNPKALKIKSDNSHGMSRTEVLCAKCDGHLGHVFDDGPQPTGLRYCINSASLDFVSKKDLEKEKEKAKKE